MGIVDEDIARVRASTDFVALVGQHLALRRVGTRWVGLCPFHAEKTPSFNVNMELGRYYCFGCGASGDAIQFVREVEHLDFVEAVERLAAQAGITLRYDTDASGRDHLRRTRIFETVEKAVAWYHDRLLTAPDAAQARSYLRRERGYDGDLVRRYLLGWAPDGWDQLIKSLGVPARALVDAGLAAVDESGRYTDFFRGRLLFPILDSSGHAVGAGGRMLPGGRPPKYKNTTGTAVYDKSNILYGLNWAKQTVVRKGQVVVCEGYTDVIGLHGAGVGEAVATCGTALAEGHVKSLTRFARRIVLAYDADAAGQAAAERFYEWERRYEVDIRVLTLPAGSDPADLARSDPAALASAVEEARPYLGFRLERLFGRADLSTPEGRARAAADAVALIAEHPNELVRDQYIMEAAGRCRVEPDKLRRMAASPRPTAVGGDPSRGDPSRGDPRRGDQRPGDQRRGDQRAGAARGESPYRDAPARITIKGPELEALRLAVHRPGDVASRLEAALFAHPVARAAFDSLSVASTLHEAIESSDPQTADLLQRLAVQECGSEPDDVVPLLVAAGGRRLLQELQAEMGQADTASQADCAATIAWIQQSLETMQTEDAERTADAQDAEKRLVGLIVARDAGADGTK